MAIRFSYVTIGWHGPLSNTLAIIARAGYSGVELFDVLDQVEHGSDLSGMLSRNGLELAGTWVGGSFVERKRLRNEIIDFKRTVRITRELGGNQIVVGGGRITGGKVIDEWGVLMASVKRLAQAAKRSKVQLLWHPHCGSLITTPDDIDRMAAETDPGSVRFAFDIAHLAKAGGDPILLLERHFERVGHVHMKDLSGGRFVELGAGDLPIIDFFQVLKARNYDGWVSVEVDSSPDPEASANANADFVSKHLGGLLTSQR